MRRRSEARQGTLTTEDRSSVEESPLEKARSQAARELEALVMENGFAKVVERVFEIDIWGEYEELEKGLKLGSVGSSSYGQLVIALDQAEDNARRAHQLYVAARVAQQRYEMDAEVLEASMRETAARSLQAEKDTGKRSKAITEEDIKKRMSSLFPDERRALEEKRLKARKMVEHMERLADLWKTRPHSLGILINTMRR